MSLDEVGRPVEGVIVIDSRWGPNYGVECPMVRYDKGHMLPVIIAMPPDYTTLERRSWNEVLTTD